VPRTRFASVVAVVGVLSIVALTMWQFRHLADAPPAAMQQLDAFEARWLGSAGLTAAWNTYTPIGRRREGGREAQ